MRASEARELTLASIDHGPELRKALAAIVKAAREGRFSISCPHLEHKDHILGRLREMGYTVAHHTVPPSTDPREHNWDEISW